MEKPEENDNAAHGSVESSDLLAIATAALERIAKCEDAPDIDATGEYQTGLYCGVEDLGILDRYQGADYGHAVGVEKALEWASNVAKHALGQMTSNLNWPPPSLLTHPQDEMVSCPFCGENDFDRIGLKIHISSGHCDSYNTLSEDKK